MAHYHLTGVDEATTILLTFPTTTPSNLPNQQSYAVAMTHLRVSTDPDGENTAGPAIRIQGTKGEIQIYGPSHRPERYRLILSQRSPDSSPNVREVEFGFPGNGRGLYWEADEAAFCVRDGKLESEGLPWEESIIIMEVMDEVRRQGGLSYPENIESTIWPLRL
jgi:predicted dehydrogenase